MVKDFKDLKATGNPAVDMVAQLVYEQRRKNIPIKTIYLSNLSFVMFEDYVKFHRKDYETGKFKLEFDGVDIVKDFLMRGNIRWDSYPNLITHV